MKRMLPFLGGLLLTFAVATAATAPRKNVLLISVDDLKPALGAYGDPLAQTPNLDRLAGRGMRFDLAYCNQSVCAPSRNHLMLGSRSTSIGVYTLGLNFRRAVPDAVTMTQHFMRHGWRAEAIGKILHTGHGNHDDEASWSVPSHPEKVVEYLEPKNSADGQLTREEAYFSNRELDKVNSLPRGAAWEVADVPDDAYADGRIASEGIRRLRAAATQRQTPFFLALGFVKPHLPLSAPKRYWDRFDRAAFPLAATSTPPEGARSTPAKSVARSSTTRRSRSRASRIPRYSERCCTAIMRARRSWMRRSDGCSMSSSGSV